MFLLPISCIAGEATRQHWNIKGSEEKTLTTMFQIRVRLRKNCQNIEHLANWFINYVIGWCADKTTRYFMWDSLKNRSKTYSRLPRVNCHFDNFYRKKKSPFLNIYVYVACLSRQNTCTQHFLLFKRFFFQVKQLEYHGKKIRLEVQFKNLKLIPWMIWWHFKENMVKFTWCRVDHDRNYSLWKWTMRYFFFKIWFHEFFF